MNKGKEMHVEGVRIKRKGSIVWIAGKCARTVRQVGRAERVTGETWRIRTGTGRDGQGYEGPWGGAEEYRRRWKSRVSKVGGGRNIRLDAAALWRDGYGGCRVAATAETRLGMESTQQCAHETRQPVAVAS